MNTNVGLIGKKLGNTQIFNDDGSVTAVTAIEVGPCTVVGKRTKDKDGYNAVQLGFGAAREKRVNKAQKAAFEKAGVAVPEVLKEFRVEDDKIGEYEVGQTLSAGDIFSAGQFVDVSGSTKGRGFTGVIKRWNFAGAGTVGHGTHEYKRHGGSIGMNMTPGRTLANQKMPGHYGSEKISIQNLKVAKVLADDNVVLVKGGVPGPAKGVVTIRQAVKKKAKAE